MQRDDQRTPPPDHKPSVNAAAEATDNEGNQSIDAIPLYRKRRVVIPVTLVILAAVAGAWYWYVNLRNFVSTDDAYVDQNRVSISSKILGRVSSLTVDEGDTVTQGQLLVRLDDADLLAQKEQAVASLRFAEESVGLAKVNISRAQDDYARAEHQFKDDVITKEQYDHARSALEGARAEYGIAVSRIGTARAQVGVVQAQLENCAIASPVDGKVARRWVLRGDVVQAGQPIFSVYDRRETWVTANLEETNLQAVHLNQQVTIAVDGFPGRTYSGRVFQIGSSTAAQFSLIPPNNASGNFTKITQRVPVKISIVEERAAVDQPIELLPGMSVEVRIKVR
jgi:membrane fusion protein (multidrug efflux system)